MLTMHLRDVLSISVLLAHVHVQRSRALPEAHALGAVPTKGERVFSLSKAFLRLLSSVADFAIERLLMLGAVHGVQQLVTHA